jgi:hypothetical protein
MDLAHQWEVENMLVDLSMNQVTSEHMEIYLLWRL